MQMIALREQGEGVRGCQAAQIGRTKPRHRFDAPSCSVRMQSHRMISWAIRAIRIILGERCVDPVWSGGQGPQRAKRGPHEQLEANQRTDWIAGKTKDQPWEIGRAN